MTYDSGATRVVVIGTDFGVYYTANDGTSWTAVDSALPNVVDQLSIDPQDTTLVAFTHGRRAFATSLSGGATAVRVTRFAGQRAGGTVRFTWHVGTNVGIAGFNLYASGHRLNLRLIPVHHSRTYHYSELVRSGNAFKLKYG